MSQLRKAEFLQNKFVNCLNWLKDWSTRWHIQAENTPAILSGLTTKVTEISNDKDLVMAYSNEMFFEALMRQEWLRSFFVTLHKYYKLSGEERNTEVDKLLADGRILLDKATQMLDFAEANKELLKQDLFKAGAYTEIFFWPYLYAEK